MDDSVACAVEQIDDLFNLSYTSDEESHDIGSLPEDAADAQAQVREGSPSRIVDLGMELRDDMQIFFS